MENETSIPSARAFVRGLNVLLKFARLYGLEHVRTATQLQSTWLELQEAMEAASEGGLLLGASESQLLLDGVPLETTPAERSFADFLTAAGVASICFKPELSKDGFERFIRAFVTAGPKAAGLIEQLKKLAGPAGESGIRINEIRFVAEDAAYADARVAAQLTARTLGADSDKIQEWFKDPEKLIQLIAAAEGSAHGPGSGVGDGRGAGAGFGGGASFAAGAGPLAAATGGGVASGGLQASGVLVEEDVRGLLKLLVQLAEASRGKPGPADLAAWRQQVSGLSAPAQINLREALAGLAAVAKPKRPGEPVLLRLAEDLAIRFALERYERGEVRVNAVRQLLERMGHEVETLRKLLSEREEKMAKAGLRVESHADLLDRQFWARVPQTNKRRVLLSADAWCVPPRNVQQYVEELLGRGDSDTADAILLQYASCVRSKDPEARRKAAIGLGQLAELYSRTASERIERVIREIGQQMEIERDPELQTLLSAAFVRFAQEAAQRRYFPAMQEALDSLSTLEDSRPSWVHSLRPRIGVENRLPEYVEEAVAAPEVPRGLVEVLKRLPQSASEHLAVRLGRCSRQSERERVIALAQEMGDPCARHLRAIFHADPAPKALSVVGLLSRLDPIAVEAMLPARLREGHRATQDLSIHQLAVGGARERGRMMLGVLGLLDSRVAPLALDEIGMSGDPATASDLLRVAAGEMLPDGNPLVQVKSIEALGRLHASGAAEPLRQLVGARHAWHWTHPSEMRVAAVQSLEKLDPTWAEGFIPRAGLDQGLLALAPLDARPERGFIRYRRYPRIHLARPIPVTLTSQRGKFSSVMDVLSLEGGLLSGDLQLSVGTEATLRIPCGLRPIQMDVVVRFVRSHQVGVEAVGMNLKDRLRLRRLLVSLARRAPAVEQGMVSAA